MKWTRRGSVTLHERIGLIRVPCGDFEIDFRMWNTWRPKAGPAVGNLRRVMNYVLFAIDEDSIELIPK
jgi:hypothetical protein